MSAYQEENGTWTAHFRYKDKFNKSHQKTKRGFATEEEALDYEDAFKAAEGVSMSMTFEKFYEVYEEDVKPSIKEHTWTTKEPIIKKKILPFFGKMKMEDIKSIDIIRWQNELLTHVRPDGTHYSKTYLRTVNNQLNAIFNHASRYYNLFPNPATKTSKMGSKEADSMSFWTKDEYLLFSEEMMDKEDSFIMFEILYWTGVRVGELLALTPNSFNFAKLEMKITASYQRIGKRDVITDPKTEKSIRVIKLAQFLADEVEEYLKNHPEIQPDERIFKYTKSYLYHEMKRGCKASGVKKIRIHDLRHSHVSLLIHKGFTVLAIAERLGHESSDITFRYAHLFPSVQDEMAEVLNMERGDVRCRD